MLTQDPDSLGLVGYDRKFLHVNLSTMGPGGERVITSAKRYVVQLGWGPPVEQIMQGEEVPMMFTMCRFQCKFPTALGWPEGPIPASLVLTELERHVPSEAVAEIRPRHNDTATCLVHFDFTDTLLRASGKHSVFYKEVSPAQGICFFGLMMPCHCKMLLNSQSIRMPLEWSVKDMLPAQDSPYVSEMSIVSKSLLPISQSFHSGCF